MNHSAVYARNRRDLNSVVAPVKKDKALTVEQVRTRLNCSKSHVNNLINEGKLAAFKIGAKRGKRVNESDLDRYQQEQIEKFGGVDDE